TRRRTRQALTAPSSISAVTPAISAWRRPSMVDAARFTARPTASSIELVEVPVSVIVFSTIEVSSRRRRAPPFHYRRGLRRRCKLRRADGALAAHGRPLGVRPGSGGERGERAGARARRSQPPDRPPQPPPLPRPPPRPTRRSRTGSTTRRRRTARARAGPGARAPQRRG